MTTSSSPSYVTCQSSTAAHQRANAGASRQSTARVYQRTVTELLGLVGMDAGSGSGETVAKREDGT
jgi:hypothetical protein